MKEITQTMVDDFNAEMVLKSSAYRLLKQEGNDWAWEINVMPDVFEEHRPMIYPNDKFYNILEAHFKKCGIEVSYNNTHTIIWAK